MTNKRLAHEDHDWLAPLPCPCKRFTEKSFAQLYMKLCSFDADREQSIDIAPK